MNAAFEISGAELQQQELSGSEMEQLSNLGDNVDPQQPGHRLQRNSVAESLTNPGSTLLAIAQTLIGPNAKAVRAVLFNKTAKNNWPLGWHQDRTISVQKRANIEGFEPYTSKSGILHVQPPADVIEKMITLRAHLDTCNSDNAPLKVALGSHLQGLIPVIEVADVAAKAKIEICLAAPGNVWAYRTLILHASERAEKPSQRRVLQVDFTAHSLPKPLKWLGV